MWNDEDNENTSNEPLPDEATTSNEPLPDGSISEVDSEIHVYRAKSGRQWSTCPPGPSRTRSATIFRTGNCGPRERHQTKENCFQSFFPDMLLQKIMNFTNKHGASDAKRRKAEWNVVDLTEMKAFIGLLYLLGVSKGNHENVRKLWSDGPLGRPVFKATMSVNRFEAILCHLRFDNSDTRAERKANDKFAPFREVWNVFVELCRNNYTPSAEVCIDEQLIPFRGRCPFRQYLPAKPDKYGMKLFLLVDCKTGYIYNGEPYVGKIGDKPTKGLASKIVKSLSAPLLTAGRNITADNCFSDFALADELLRKKTTYVGTLRKNKPDIPPDFQANRTREAGSSLFGFDENTTIVSYVPKKNKSVLLISTLHNDSKVDSETGKPEIILYYNHTKRAVDTVDQMCHAYSVQRRTKRWPLAYFMNLINLGGLNSFILYIHEFPHWNEGVSYRRRQFLEELGLELVQPLMQKRAIRMIGLQRPIQNAMFACGINPAAEINEHEEESRPQSKRRRCYYCTSDRKASGTCKKCQKPVCRQHSTKAVLFECIRKCEA